MLHACTAPPPCVLLLSDSIMARIYCPSPPCSFCRWPLCTPSRTHAPALLCFTICTSELHALDNPRYTQGSRLGGAICCGYFCVCYGTAWLQLIAQSCQYSLRMHLAFSDPPCPSLSCTTFSMLQHLGCMHSCSPTYPMQSRAFRLGGAVSCMHCVVVPALCFQLTTSPACTSFHCTSLTHTSGSHAW